MMKICRNNQLPIFRSCRGFSLIEILITLALTGIVMSGVYAIYIANIRAVTVDEQRVEIQQGQRFAMDFIMRELRHAGYDLAETDTPTIVRAGADYIYYTADLDDSGTLTQAGEHVVFCVYTDTNGYFSLGYFSTDTVADVNMNAIDADDDGFTDSGHTHTNPSHQAISTIEAIEFYYTLADGTQTTTPSADGVDLDDIRSVEISLLSRADREDARYKQSRSFTTASGATWPNAGTYTDGFRRMMMSSTVRFRNMGL